VKFAAIALVMLIVAAPALPQDAPPIELPRAFALIICGISGDEPHYEKFWTLGTDLYYALRDKCGYPEDRIFFLFEEKPQGQQIVRATSRKADIIKAFVELKQKLRPKDKLLIFIAGHADDEKRAHTTFHLPGPDMTDEDLGKLVDTLPVKRITTVVTTPVSGHAMRYLAKPGRITITATKADKELSETVFPYCFVKAFEDETADQNADGLLSVLEIFRYAKEKVLDFYLEKNIICTEHAMIDDDGDGIGARAVDENAKDGKRAEQEYFEIRVKG